ncbi:ABC transporter permease [Desulfurobacterium thermolithotrophum]|uniref:ABC transporter permease n=1 Tax=Desulfurobacterium thermolithotrophum TaxID=64160 RepID=UPI0013D765DD|nr:ABC transporter permease [Desulfurobacterium thermolithotrophum]
MKNQKILLLLIGLLTFFCFAFIIIPILNIFVSINPESLKSTLKDGEVWNAIFTTLKGATFSTTLGLIIGVPTSYFLSTVDFRGKSFLESLLNLPIVIPHVAVGIILLKLLSQNSTLGKFFSHFGIHFVDTIYGIIVAMCFVSISYTITSSLLGFRSINKELIWTARSLGASPFQVLRFVVLPLAFPYILRGAILSFARSISEVGALLIIAYYPITAPILMYERFEDYGLKASTPIAVLMMLISFLIFIILLSISYRSERKSA